MKWMYPLVLFFVLPACTNKTKVPSDVLPKNKMELVLWDMIKADRFAMQYITRDTAILDRETKKFEMFEKVFQIHKISGDEFIHSMKFYLARPDITKVIFDSISAKANRNKAELFQPTLK